MYILEAVGASGFRDSAYKVGLASVLESRFLNFVPVSYFECGDKVVWTGLM